MLYWSSKMYLDADISVKKKRYQKLLEKISRQDRYIVLHYP